PTERLKMVGGKGGSRSIKNIMAISTNIIETANMRSNFIGDRKVRSWVCPSSILVFLFIIESTHQNN
ncbi:MAG: hypothetical protein Q7T25_10300, partial [Sideroxyarcus sp.]|nr:hypothetical protein [Sideroxyarcus sp.]